MILFYNMHVFTLWLWLWFSCYMLHIFEFIVLNENVWISMKISLKFVPREPVNSIPALIQTMAWHQPGDKPLSELMMVKFTDGYNSSWPSDAIWHQRSCVTLVQVMTWCYQATSRYLNQCWLIIKGVMLWYSPESSITRWMPQNIFEDKSALVQIMAWCLWRQGITLVLTQIYVTIWRN